MKEIKIGPLAIAKLKLGIDNLANTVLLTMGPSGSTVIINGTNGKPKITKDGVSVAKAITFEDPIENMGATLLKEAAELTVKIAGDGTTTAICLAQAFINKGFELQADGILYAKIKKELSSLEEATIKYLDNLVSPIREEDVVAVATVASNNDTVIGGVIAKAFDHSVNVVVEEGNQPKDRVELIEGMELKTGFFSNAFINNGYTQTIEYGESIILIVEGHLTNLKGVQAVVDKHPADTSFIIVADDFSTQVVKILKDNYNKGALVVGLIKSPGYASHRLDLLDDLKVAIGATKLVGVSNIAVGKINSIRASKEKTTIAYNRNPLVDKLLTELKGAIENTKEEYDKELLKQRIHNLEGNLSVIYVGGSSEIEMKERYDRMEDAVLATRNAISEGVIDGGGLPLYTAGSGSRNPFGVCLAAPMLHMKLREDLIKENILDPVKVTKTALINAISVAKTILGTKAVVLSEYQWK